MATRTCRALLMAAVLLAAAATAGAAVYRNKTTGETLRGTLTTQRINGQNVFNLANGQTRYVNPDDWELIEADPPAPQPPAAAPPAAAPSAATPSAAAPPSASAPPAATPKPAVKNPPSKGAEVAYVLPISGIIRDVDVAYVEALEKGLAEARQKKASIIILRVNTAAAPSKMNKTVEQMVKAIEDVDWATVVSFVNGENRQAGGVGVYICLASQKIFMAPDCKIGNPLNSWELAVDAQGLSRRLAEKRGYPASVAEGMTSGGIIYQIFLDNKPMLLTWQETVRLEDEHKADGRCRRGEMVRDVNQMLMLTSAQAVEYKLCAGIVANEKALLAAMGMGNYRIIESSWGPDWVAKNLKGRQK